MMVPSKLRNWLQFLHIFLLFNGLQCSTHWVVTEDGRVQQQMDSVFVMKRPYDLVALMQQEKRADLVDSLKQELFVQKEQIDKNEDKETNLEENFYKTNPHCIIAEGKQLSELSLYAGTYITMKERNLDVYEWIISDEILNKYEEPVCTAFSKLDVSMFSYDHLNSVKDRKNLTIPKDSSLLEAVVDLHVPRFGHFIHQSLKENKTSWMYYNVAAYFWRIQGDAVNAVECLRRALHFVPKEYRDVCLLNLANILHMAHQSEEAAIIMHNAIDLQPNIALYHYVLGTIYAILVDYNASLICFDNAVKLEPHFYEAKLLKNVVLCHSQLEKALESQHDSLQRTLGELKELQKHQEQLFYQQEKLRAEQATFSTKIEQRLQYEEQKLREALEARGAKCCHFKKDGQAVVSCSIDNEASKIKSAEIHILHGIMEDENSNGSVDKVDSDKVDSVLSMSLTEDFQKQNLSKRNGTSQNEQPPLMPHLYPRKFSQEEQVQWLHYQDPAWPSQEECNKTMIAFPPADRFPSVYISPENKGFNVRNILTALQGLGPISTHSLPWYPPFCDNSFDAHNSTVSQWINQLPSLQDQNKLMTTALPETDIREHLLAYVDIDRDIAEEEIGQRIMTAISKSLAPNWVLCTIAALYWRVQGNIMNAITCLKNSLATTPENLIDVPLVSLASILFKLKEFDDAVAVMHKALSVNNIEPISNFFVANLYAVTGNFSGAVHHYKQALNVEPANAKIVEYAKIVTCYLKVHLKNRMSKITQMQQSALETCEAITSRDVTKLPEIYNLKTAPCTAFCFHELDNHQIAILESCTVDTVGFSLSKDDANQQTIRITNSEFVITATPASEIENNDTVIAKEGQVIHDEIKSTNIVDEFVRTIQEPSLSSLRDEEPVSRRNNVQVQVKVNVGSQTVNHIDHIPNLSNEVSSLFTKSDDSSEDIPPDYLLDDDLPQFLLMPKGKPVYIAIQNTPECDAILLDTNLKQLTSTWLSVSSKNIVVSDYLKATSFPDKTDVVFGQKVGNSLPHCSSEFPASMLTLDHLSGVRNRHKLTGRSEMGLRDAFLSLWGDLQSRYSKKLEKSIVDTLGHHLANALKKNSTSWVLTTISALYWRIAGNAEEAVNCLRHALHYAPRHMKDIPLVSLANVLQRAGLHNDAIITTNMALEISPRFVVIHFTMANIYASKGDFLLAKAFYESSLSLQTTFEPARERLKAIQCGHGHFLTHPQQRNILQGNFEH